MPVPPGGPLIPSAASGPKGGTGPLVRAFLLVTLVILLTEASIMVVLESRFQGNRWVLPILDSGLLILITTPFIYRLLVKPMAFHLFEEAEAERALQEASETNRHLRQEAEDHLREEILERTRSSERIQFQARILSAVQQGVVAAGKDGRILYWNAFAEQMFGWSEDEILGRPLATVTTFTSIAMRRSLSIPGPGKGWSGDVLAVRKNGEWFPTHLTCSPTWHVDGSVSGVVFTFIDITDRKKAEEELRNSEEKYSTLVENSPTGIFIYREGRLEFANLKFFQMVGRPPSDLRAIRFLDLVHPEDQSAIEKHLQLRLEGSLASRDYECRILTASGTVRWISGRSTIIPFGGANALLGNIQDITEKQRAEQALRDSREALHCLSVRLLTAQEGERQRVAAELHDSIGQSLSAIKFMVEHALVLAGGDTSDDMNGHLQSLRNVVPVIQASVEEVRRISTALRPSILDDLGLLATLAWFTREFQVAYPHLQVEKSVEIEESEVPDPLKINVFRIVQEAMNNAAKHSSATRALIGLQRVPQGLQLVIADNGQGFDPAVPQRGLGLGGFGLASMRERAELFGGLLTITSGEHQGTTIMARWPLPEKDPPVTS